MEAFLVQCIDMKSTLMMVLCSAAILVSGCATSHSHKNAWEYKVLNERVSKDIEKHLNQLASDGWVVVSSSISGEPNTTPIVLVILKRHLACKKSAIVPEGSRNHPPIAPEASWNPPNSAVTPGLARFYKLGALIESQYNQHDYTNVEVLSTEYLQLAPTYRGNWNYGNAIHDGNRYLGLISLQKGSIEDAVLYLRKAATSPGSPQLDSFGPELDLANSLLQQGKREDVKAYLNSIKSFWKGDRGRVNQWLKEIDAGENPKLERF